MAAFGKKARFACVWLTALLTLFAGFPHVQCRCPSGHIKPYCLSFFFRNPAHSGCCCASEGRFSRDCCAAKGRSRGGCCLAPDAPSATEALPTCCADAHGGQAGKAVADGLRVDAPCCTRTVVKSADFAPTPSRPGPAAAPLSVADLPSPAFPSLLLAGDWALRSWQAHRLAPPTDLITVLQRLTI